MDLFSQPAQTFLGLLLTASALLLPGFVSAAADAPTAETARAAETSQPAASGSTGEAVSPTPASTQAASESAAPTQASPTEAAPPLSSSPATAETPARVPAPAEAPTGITDKSFNAPPVSVSGSLIDAATKRPISGARISVRNRGIVVSSDEKGHFTLPPLPQRLEVLDISARGYGQYQVSVRIRAGQALEPIPLKKAATRDRGESETIEVVETVVEEREPIEHVLTLPELKRVPGTFNDAVRAVQNLPGVARNPIGILIVRGTEPQDTGYYIDGIRVPQIFHFLGLHTVVNSDMLDEITFLPGNYGVRYGRTYGGVVDVRTTEDIPQAYDGYVAMDLINSSAFAKIPISSTIGMYASVRRSYVDLVLDKGLETYQSLQEDDVNIQLYQAPKYWDYQLLYNQQVNSRNFVHAMVFGAQDKARLAGNPPESIHPDIQGNGEVGTSSQFHKGLVRWRYSGEKASNQLTLALGPDVQSFFFGGLKVRGTNGGFFVRDDVLLRYSPTDHIRVTGGLDLLLGLYEFEIQLPFNPLDASLDPLDDPTPYTNESRGLFVFPSPYVNVQLDITSHLLADIGLRVDPFIVGGIYKTIWADPRLNLQYKLKEGSTIKASAGRYGTNPQPFAVDPDSGGDPTLKSPYALQYSLGFDHALTSFLNLGLTTYYSDMRRLVIIPNDSSTPSLVNYTNDGRGRSYGAEMLLRWNPYKNLFGWVSYTLQKAERLEGTEAAPQVECDNPEGGVSGPCWYPFDFDQTHILTLVASYDLPKGWTLGGRFRYSTGVPYTPVAGSYYDVDSNSFESIPAFDGQRNTARVPAFNDLTLRVDKSFKVKNIKAQTYLEVLNVYNRKNPEQVSYSYDYEEYEYVNSLPIFPNLGFKAEF